ncbi:Dynein regulatory complex subunit 5, partial [Schistosoma japonicum]
SHVNSEQCRLLAIHLQNHSTLNCLNLSHNSIGYRGIRALSKLLTGNNRITSLNLTNNRLKSSSGLSIAYALTQSTCSLVQLNLCMNKLQDEGGIAIAKQEVPNVQQSIPSEITSVARRQRPLIEYPSEVSFAALEV